VILKSFLYIPESMFDYKLAKSLVIENPEYDKRLNSGLPLGDMEAVYVLYKKFEKNGKVFYRVPRYAFGNYSEVLKQYPQLVKGYSEVKECIEFKESSIEFNPSQKETIEKTIAMLEKELGAIVVAATGEGKSQLFIKIMCLLGMKTLILVHKDFLIGQWKENLLKLTNLKENEIGLLKQGKFIDGKVVLGSMQSLMRGTIDNSINDKFGLVCGDEIHHIGAKMFLRAFTRFNSKLRCGLSVVGDTRIFISHNDIIEHLEIQEFYNRFNFTRNKWNIVDGYKIRSFNGKEFIWKNVTGVLKHSVGKKKIFQFLLDKNVTVALTEDHSTYKVVGNSYKFIKRDKKYIASLEEVLGKDLKVGDYLLLEDKIDSLDSVDIMEFNILEYMTGKFYVAGDYTKWIENNITLLNGYKWHYKKRHKFRNGKYGVFIPGDMFSKFNNIPDCGTKIYTEGSCGHWLSYKIPVNVISYLLGFYLGDGWVSGGQLSFAIGIDEYDRFMKKLNLLIPYSNFGVFKRVMRGKSYEIKINCSPLANFFKTITNGAKSYNKFIPKEVYSFSENNIREFISGLMESDGHLGKKKLRYYYTTTSKRLADDIVQILKRVNVVSSVSNFPSRKGGIIDDRQIKSKRIKYVVNFSSYELHGDNTGYKGRRFPFIMNDLGGVPAKIRKVSLVKDVKNVYDINVEGTNWNTFVGSGVLVHNSATPDREDKMEKLYYYHLSSNLIIHNNVRNVGSEFYVIEYERVKAWKWYPAFIPFKIQLIHNIVADEVRNKIILDMIVELRKKGRKILVLSERISHLTELIYSTGKRLPSDSLVRFFGAKSLTKKERAEGVKQEKVKDPTKEELINGDVIFGTYSKVKEGVDIPQLDTLIFATPLSSKTTVIQAKGRIERFAEGKEKPVVIDIYDTDKSLLIGMFQKRKRLYKELQMRQLHLFSDIL